jgi:hypothetical protein
VTDILQADLDVLHKLGGVLSGRADAIAQIKVSAAVTMPGSPVQDAAAGVGDAVVAAYGLIGSNIRQMSENAQQAAKTYEQVDTVFADQMHKYTSGLDLGPGPR